MVLFFIVGEFLRHRGAFPQKFSALPCGETVDLI